MAPYPKEPAASVYKCRASADNHWSGRKNALPLKWRKNNNQACNSAFASELRRIWWCGFDIPIVKLIRRRKNARPGTTTLHAKFRRPITDCSSFRVILVLFNIPLIVVMALAILSHGNRASSSIPANVRHGAGPSVFFWCERYSHTLAQTLEVSKVSVSAS